ncbi:strawberry notch-like NTP hydrolase domain-containing protein [Rubrivirga sp.]|uniref:strawberry notch-like NTP hydrolase domain-containing protein n=1 Tax=Rubrivirga sp. TaxID=1885344 RepID=UPI003C75E1F7
MAPSASHVAPRATNNPVEQLDLFALLAPRIARLGVAPPRPRAQVAPQPQLVSAWPFADALPLAVTAVQETAQTGALTASVFDAYRPSVRVPGACPHPTRLVESAAMAAAIAPPSAYRRTLPEHLVTQGILSDAQLETVSRAGAAHAEHLPGEGGESGPRQGFFVGDGTGVGRDCPRA